MSKLRFAAFAAMAVPVSCAFVPDESGEESTDEEVVEAAGDEIKNGSTVSPTVWRVAQVGGGCSGTVIDPWWVLSASHCVGSGSSEDPNDWTITLGTEDRQATHIYRHPGWLDGVDVIMFRLEAPFTNIPQTEMTLWTGDTDDLHYNVAVCTGYGATDVGGTCATDSDCSSGWFCQWGRCMEDGGTTLRAANLRIVPDYGDSPDTNKYFGLEVPNALDQMTLPGDSGGSCQWGGFVVGVTKAGNATNYNRQTSAEAWQDWVEARRDCAGFDPNNPLTGFCSSTCPCDMGEGDCDSDSQCLPGLFCRSNIGPSYGLPADYDVCESHKHLCPIMELANPDTDYCVDLDCPCNHGQGDCDTDRECGAGLICQDDSGAAVGLPAHYEICVYPPAPGCPSYNPAVDNPSFCSTTCPCDLGQGDCDSDAECRGEFVCTPNVGATYGKPASYGICEKP